MKGSPATRIPRGRRGTFAGITALLGTLAFAAVAAEAISMAAHGRTLVLHSRDIAKFGRDTTLSDDVVLVVAIVAFALGVILVLAALLPARRRLVELSEPDPTVAAGLTRRSLRRTLAAAALGVDGVSSAKLSGRRRLTVHAATPLRDTASLPDHITERVTARLGELNPARTPTVRVVLKRKDD